ncbi:hypothetical protein BJ165DRAFT_682614 [Panaeolus papilionaceus]|nr:hypothetical protein BJ165DRAFT_682614 [Panaeolus papilionaceus]
MATVSSDPVYENLIIDGAISAEPVELSSIPEYSAIILLLGPIASGKSSVRLKDLSWLGPCLTPHIQQFLRSIAPETPSGAATTLRDEPYGVIAYRLQGVRAKLWNGLGVYIFKIPGFHDEIISELEVVKMVQDWTADLNDRIMAFYVLYFDPITDVRLSGSKRQLFRMLRAMRTDESQHGTTLLTTMWDRIPESGMERAERRFQLLKSQNLVSINSSILRFENTSASAMSVLNTILIGTADGFTGLRPQSRGAEALQMLTKAALSDRIHTLQIDLEGVEQELRSEAVQGDHALKEVYLSKQAHVTAKLKVFRMEENGIYQHLENLSTNVDAKELPANQVTRLKSPIALYASSGPLHNICASISIRRVRREDIVPYSNLFVLMGPTGTGKSSVRVLGYVSLMSACELNLIICSLSKPFLWVDHWVSLEGA